MDWSANKRSILAYLVMMLLVASVVVAQTSTTSLRGTITDPKGASVPGATVTIANTGIGLTLTTTTDWDGAYQFAELQPATYALTVVAAGFATLKQSGLQLLVATPRTYMGMQIALINYLQLLEFTSLPSSATLIVSMFPMRPNSCNPNFKTIG